MLVLTKISRAFGRIRGNQMHFKHTSEIATLKRILDMLEEDRELTERHTYSPYVDALSRWVDKVPTLCHGVDLKTKCGHPQEPDENGRKHVTDLCWDCQDKQWRKNPPPLSKHEQRVIDKMEELYQKIEGSEISLQDFAKAMKPLQKHTDLKRTPSKKYVRFHEDMLGEKYKELFQEEQI